MTHQRHPPQPPTLGTALRQIREYLGLSREAAYAHTRVSVSHLKNIERDDKTPSPPLLDDLIRGYRLDPTQAEYLHNLRGTPHHLDPPDVLRAKILESPRLATHLLDLERRGVLAAYVDPTWTILFSNGLFRTANPGLDEQGSVPVWVFSRAGRSVLADYDAEAHIAVSSVRGVSGRFRGSLQVREIFGRLRNNPEFRERWHTTIDVTFIRPTETPVRLRDDTGNTTAYTLTISPTDPTHEIHLLTAVQTDLGETWL
ncbi:helix-turn-helix domain-containing protein [Nocardia bhagyanarayanae]|uniref:Helix-turn-helix protein n=1 Tax=Nocardia bhagyanarayanae TaxID=1215925 RepID=A0A543FFM9_9NOCA|nr:helix-turn-helix domain-containing protein [Nocardia bhagyanarayanae]TQM32667.1 helix-turn-helix protein [Nocardia bhagyanarayanae]